MINPRPINCPSCPDYEELLRKIDCKLSQLGVALYNDISFMLNNCIDLHEITRLIRYKRIIQYKYTNNTYLSKYNLLTITNRINRLTIGCKTKCTEPVLCKPPTCNIEIYTK